MWSTPVARCRSRIRPAPGGGRPWSARRPGRRTQGRDGVDGLHGRGHARRPHVLGQRQGPLVGHQGEEVGPDRRLALDGERPPVERGWASAFGYSPPTVHSVSISTRHSARPAGPASATAGRHGAGRERDAEDRRGPRRPRVSSTSVVISSSPAPRASPISGHLLHEDAAVEAQEVAGLLGHLLGRAGRIACCRT